MCLDAGRISHLAGKVLKHNSVSQRVSVLRQSQAGHIAEGHVRLKICLSPPAGQICRMA